MSNKIFEEITKEFILINFPMFTRLVLATPIKVNEDIKTLRTNGKVVEYNPKFVKKVYEGNKSEVPLLFFHEYIHIFLGHPLRYDPKRHTDNEAFQKACDYAANAIIREAKLRVPPYFYYEFAYHNMAVQEIYDLIADTNDNSFNSDTHGEVAESPDVKNDDDKCDDPCKGQSSTGNKRQEALEEHDRQMQSDMQSAIMAGHMNKELARIVEEMFRTENNWRDILASAMQVAVGMEEYSYRTVNRRYSNGDFIYPGMYSEETQVIAVFVDTSGSIDKDTLERMTGDIVGIAEDVGPERMIVLPISTRVNGVIDFELGDEYKLNLKGGGGTDFRPGFKWLEDNDVEPDVVVYLTDGYCSRYPEEPEYPVIWVVWQDDRPVTFPFGEQIVMTGRKKRKGRV